MFLGLLKRQRKSRAHQVGMFDLFSKPDYRLNRFLVKQKSVAGSGIDFLLGLTLLKYVGLFAINMLPSLFILLFFLAFRV